MNRILELYGRFLIRDGWKKAEFYRKHRVFHSIGKDNYIPVYIGSREGYLISIGSNVWITHGTVLINHDASVQVVRKALGLPWVDKINKIDIRDNVYIGNFSIVMPGVTIGPNAIIGAGSIVTKDVPPNSVVAGNPAHFIMTFTEYATKVMDNSAKYSWTENDTFSEVINKRIVFFWGGVSMIESEICLLVVILVSYELTNKCLELLALIIKR